MRHARPAHEHAQQPGWNALALRAAGAAQALHTLALLHTCMYNAWAAYDGDARQTALGVAVRLPRTEHDAASRTAAMSHAAHGVLAGLFPEAQADVDARMASLGLAPDGAPNPFSPAGIGRTQAAAALGIRHRELPFALMPAEARQPVSAGQQASATRWPTPPSRPRMAMPPPPKRCGGSRAAACRMGRRRRREEKSAWQGKL